MRSSRPISLATPSSLCSKPCGSIPAALVRNSSSGRLSKASTAPETRSLPTSAISTSTRTASSPATSAQSSPTCRSSSHRASRLSSGAPASRGLVGALLVGVQIAKSLSAASGLPLVAVNHLEGHLLAVLLDEAAPAPPWLGLVVSGGHTSLYEVRALGRYRSLGHTLDDAAGEAFDKVAKLLGLPYPGGAHIDRLAQGGDPRAIEFPRGLSTRPREEFDFSFSGLKTAVLQYVRANGVPTGRALADLCAS